MEAFYWHKGGDNPDFEGPVVGIWNLGTDNEFSDICYFDKEYSKWYSLCEETPEYEFIPAPDCWIKMPIYDYEE